MLILPNLPKALPEKNSSLTQDISQTAVAAVLIFFMFYLINKKTSHLILKIFYQYKKTQKTQETKHINITHYQLQQHQQPYSGVCLPHRLERVAMMKQYVQKNVSDANLRICY